MEDKFADGYEDYIKDMKKDICTDSKIVIIAGKPKEFYINTIIEKMDRFDQVEIQVSDEFKEKAEIIIKFFEAVGILPENGYPIKFEKREEDIWTKDKKKTYKGYVNKLVLTKIPELCRYIYDYRKEGDNNKNFIVIGKLPKEVYSYIIMEKIQRFDQVEIRVLDAYIKKALGIIKSFDGIGILPENGYPIKFDVREEEIIPRDKDYLNTYKAIINRVVLTKVPSLYKFTHN
jgi:hypothetical protein